MDEGLQRSVVQQEVASLSTMAPDERLFNAARWSAREFNIMMNSHGGILSRDFELLMDALEKAVNIYKKWKAQNDRTAC